MSGRPEEDSRTKNWSVFIVVVSFYFFSDFFVVVVSEIRVLLCSTG